MRLILLISFLTINFSAFSVSLDSIFKNKNSLPSAPLSMSSLTPEPVSSEIAIRQGRTSISMHSGSSELINILTGKKIRDGRRSIPDISFDWVQNESGEVIPTIRHLVVSDSKYWDYILGVGEIWPETTGQETRRVSMPFTLVEKNENCSHNGVLVFDSGRSQGYFYFQISSETCAYFKADFWGRGIVTNTSLKNANHKNVITEYANEKKRRLRTKPIAMIAEHASNIQANKLSLPSKILLNDMTAYGVLLGDVHYISECRTRAGNYPFCDQMVLPSYSTAKSLFAAVSMFYLEQQYGDILSQPISKWVKQCTGDDWDDVTFSDLLDMSTGNYNSAKYHADEASPKKLAFFNATTNSQRLAFACNHYSRKSTPGKTFVYHTSDTYLLGAGLNAFVKSKLGKNADLFTDVLYEKIFKPLGLSQVSDRSRRSSDLKGQPYVGYGLFFTRDDLVRLSHFVSQQAQADAKFVVLAQKPLQAALQQNSDNLGLTTDYSFIRYQHGFWARKVTNKEVCHKPQWLPFMSGYGGITVALLARSSIYYYVSDSFHFDWTEAIPELHKLNLICSSVTTDN
ncbi:MAG: CubicO group peptidase (beta-lactamase class C family) [Glaciecola sp.]|jgi:CubicO group peptidase (beta-lactamase class C family)